MKHRNILSSSGSALLLRALVFCLAGAGAFHAAEICGRIGDPTEAGVPSATVSIQSRQAQDRRTVTTDASGNFCLAVGQEGTYLLAAHAPGFAAGAAEVRVKAGETARIALSLELARVSTTVVVTASSTVQTTEEAAKATDTVSSREFEQRAEFILAEALRTVPGVLVRQLGGPGSLARLQLRGLRTVDTAVLIDGFRFRDAAATQGDATSLVSDMLTLGLDRVEVLRGSGSSLYGSHASGGVIHLVSRQGGGARRGSLEAEGGGLGLFRGQAGVTGASKDGLLQYSAGATHWNLARGVDEDDRARNSGAHGWLQYEVAPAATLSGRLLAGDGFVQLNDNPFVAPGVRLPAQGEIRAVALPAAGGNYVPAPNDPDSRRTSRHAAAMVAFSHRPSPAIGYRLAYQGLTTRRYAHDGPGGTFFEPLFNSSTAFNSRIDSLQARTDAQAGSHHLLSAGYEYERESYDHLSRDANPDAAVRVHARAQAFQHSHTLFAQEQARLADGRLLLSLSGRTQWFRLSRPVFEGGAPQYAGTRLEAPRPAYIGDAAVAYFLNASSTKLRAHVGNGYRAPSLFERFGASFYFGSFSAYGDPRLKPERSVSADAGIEQHLASSRLRLSSTYFYTRLQEVIFFDFSGLIEPLTDPYGRFGGYRNTGGGMARGVESSAEAAPSEWLRIKGSYTYTLAQERTSMLADGSLRSFFIPDHMVTLTATQRWGRRLEVTTDLAASSSYTFPLFTFEGSRAFRFDGPRRLDVAAVYTNTLRDGRAIQWFARVENVLNRRHYEEGFPVPRLWATTGLRFLF